jgi:SWI/SNF-related matrix-associated actin-dependent regulator 1 of chromatin subfamily A
LPLEDGCAQASLPPYLLSPEWPTDTAPLARLRPLAGGTRWLLSGDPQVSMVAKRVFPGARSHGPGSVSFPNTARSMQDVRWLMTRYPIAAEAGEETALAMAVQGAARHALQRQRADRARSAPVGHHFRGVPRPYQEESLAFMLANGKTLLADDMGLGKTVQAIMLMTSGARLPALVVVQPHLVTQWMGMLDRFLEPGTLQVAKISGRGLSRDDVRRGRDIVPNADIVVMHYGLVSYWTERLLACGFGTVVFDEVGELRHRDTGKYNACSLLASAAENVAGLSGTPIYNYGIEIWSVMNAIDFQSLGPSDDFIREWTTLQGVHHMVTDPAALGAHMRREGLMMRRRKTEVQDQLPPKHRDVVEVDADDTVYRRQMQKAVPMLQQFSGADRFTRFTLSGRIGEEARRATGLAKIPGAVAFIATLLAAGEPVVVFAHHHDVVDALVEELAPWHPVCLTGRESSAQKDASKAAFIDGHAQLIIISMRSATGIDGLQARARVAVFCELDWSPAIHTQAEDRLWRDGQGGAVMVYYLVSSVGSDPDMRAKLGLKIGQAKGILDDPFDTEEDRNKDAQATSSFVANLIERLAKEFACQNKMPSDAAQG